MEYPLRQQQSASFAETGARNPANVASAPGAVEEQRHVPCFSTHFNFFCLFVFASQMEEQERPPSCRRGHFKAGDVRRSSKKKKTFDAASSEGLLSIVLAAFEREAAAPWSLCAEIVLLHPLVSQPP